jgi:hypothetical protein
MFLYTCLLSALQFFCENLSARGYWFAFGLLVLTGWYKSINYFVTHLSLGYKFILSVKQKGCYPQAGG